MNFLANCPYFLPNLGFLSKVNICSAILSTSYIGTRIPFTLFPVNSAGPVGQSVDMHGNPTPIASISALGIPSKLDESTNKSYWHRVSATLFVLPQRLTEDCKLSFAIKS